MITRSTVLTTSHVICGTKMGNIKKPPLHPCASNNNHINVVAPYLKRKIWMIFGSVDGKHHPPFTHKRDADQAFVFKVAGRKKGIYVDIGIILFNVQLLTSTIWPICLPAFQEEDYWKQKMILVGYGLRKANRRKDGTYSCFTDEVGPAAQVQCDSNPNGCIIRSPPPNVNEDE